MNSHSILVDFHGNLQFHEISVKSHSESLVPLMVLRKSQFLHIFNFYDVYKVSWYFWESIFALCTQNPLRLTPPPEIFEEELHGIPINPHWKTTRNINVFENPTFNSRFLKWCSCSRSTETFVGRKSSFCTKIDLEHTFML